MKKLSKSLFFLIVIVLSNVSCMQQSVPTRANVFPTGSNQIIIHDDGRIHYRQRLISRDDVLIYDDGRSEQAAIKTRVGIQPDFYLGPYDVIRRENKSEKLSGAN